MLHLAEAGNVTTELQFTRMFKYDVTAGGTLYHLAGTHGPSFVSGDTGTPQNRIQATVTWNRGAFELAGTLNYIGSFSVTDPSNGQPDCASALGGLFNGAQPPQAYCRVGSFTEFSLSSRYGIDKNWSIHGSITNLFNRHAPLDLQTFGATGNGAASAGATYNPALHQDGAIGRYFTVGASYAF